ncbi:hypothetical protein ACLOJK_021256 [Asimina triloba]
MKPEEKSSSKRQTEQSYKGKGFKSHNQRSGRKGGDVTCYHCGGTKHMSRVYPIANVPVKSHKLQQNPQSRLAGGPPTN